MPLITLKNLPRTGLYVTVYDTMDEPLRVVTNQLLADNLQKKLAQLLDLQEEAIAVIHGGFQMSENNNTLIIEVANVEHKEGLTHETLKNAAKTLCGTVVELTQNRIPVEVHVKEPLVSCNDICVTSR